MIATGTDHYRMAQAQAQARHSHSLYQILADHSESSDPED